MIAYGGMMLAALILSTVATAADPCPVTGPGVEWAASCFETLPTSRRVKQAYVKRLRPNHYGYTTVMISAPRELVAIDRRGKVVIPGIVHTGDFDFPTAHRGIGRFTTGVGTFENKKPSQCGYFDSRRFRVIIPPEYDQCKPFADGEALACKGCESYCTEPDCKDSVLVGGEGVVLALDGTVRRRFKLPTIGSACLKAEHGQTIPQCAPKTNNPFDQLN